MADPLEPIKYEQDIRSGQYNILPEAVKNRNIDYFTFDKAQGGTLTLGGVDNGNGVLQIKDSTGFVVSQGDNEGTHYYYDNAGVATELVRVNADGLSAFGGAINLYESTDFTLSARKGSFGYSGDLADLAVCLFSFNGAGIKLQSDTTVVIQGNGDASIYGANLNLGFGTNLQLNGANFVVDSNGGTTRVKFGTAAAKTAIVGTSQGYREMYCVEGTEVWFMDFCKAERHLKINWPKFWEWEWEWEVHPDELFLETVSSPFHIVPTTEKDKVMVYGKRQGFEKRRMNKVSPEDFESNNKFWAGQRKAVV